MTMQNKPINDEPHARGTVVAKWLPLLFEGQSRSRVFDASFDCKLMSACYIEMCETPFLIFISYY